MTDAPAAVQSTPSHRHRDTEVSSRRLAGLFRQAMSRAGGTELETDVAGVVGAAFAYSRTGTQSVGWRAIAARCKAAGVTSSRYWCEGEAIGQGTVTRVLYALRAIGLLTWERAHVARFHGNLPPDPREWPRLRPVWTAWGYRLPPRELTIVGFAATLAAFLGVDGREPEPLRGSEGCDGLEADQGPEACAPAVRRREQTQPSPNASTSPIAHGSGPAFEAYELLKWEPPF